MIVLHDLHGQPFGINGALIERVSGGTETHVLLTSGTSYIVSESVEDVVAIHREDRALVLALARHVPIPPGDGRPPIEGPLRLVTASMSTRTEAPT